MSRVPGSRVPGSPGPATRAPGPIRRYHQRLPQEPRGRLAEPRECLEIAKNNQYAGASSVCRRNQESVWRNHESVWRLQRTTNTPVPAVFAAGTKRVSGDRKEQPIRRCQQCLPQEPRECLAEPRECLEVAENDQRAGTSSACRRNQECVWWNQESV